MAFPKRGKTTSQRQNFEKPFSHELSLSIKGKETSLRVLNWVLKLSKPKFDRNISVTIMAIIKLVGWWGLCVSNEFKGIQCGFQNLHNVIFSL